MKRYEINISGRVQGVGFRPTVYHYAKIRDLTGFVFNTTNGVVVEIEGSDKAVKDFLNELKARPPKQSKITKITSKKIPCQYDKKFIIRKSVFDKESLLHISPDISICDDCYRELFDENNRRYLYPFINCTNCGPRFSIIRDVPYDRKNTTMLEFKMCNRCRTEYEKPADRRFHAQPDACWDCGPDVQLIKNHPDKVGTRIKNLGDGKKAVEKTVELLKAGKIVAIKGIGGFHIACDATNDKVIKKLRLLKKRPDKPFAVMMPDIKTVKKFCCVSKSEEKILGSPESPIVLLRKKPSLSHSFTLSLSEHVAPDNNYLGVMLPYTPLHYLLFHLLPTPYSLLPALIMTSGNKQDEPICKDNKKAVKELSKICDYFLIHNRVIYNRCDDSIVRMDSENNLVIVRRSRGYTPNPIQFNLPAPSRRRRGKPSIICHPPSILATGAELKNTFCLTRRNEAYISQYIGDLKDFNSYKFYKETVDRFKGILKVDPKIIVHDMHPDYFSTQYASEVQGLEFPPQRGEARPDKYRGGRVHRIGVQHHHAHIASVCAENNIKEKIIGVVFDGTGYGSDGNIWGGEFLVTEGSETFQRKYHLKYVKLPGGDAATSEIWRIGFSYLYDVLKEDTIKYIKTYLKYNCRDRYSVIKNMMDKNINCPLTSSVGRLFDAVASIINLRQKTSYEAQAAIELEQIAIHNQGGTDSRYEYEVIGDKIDVRRIIMGIIDDLKKKRAKAAISEKFHNTLAEIINEICKRIRKETGISRVALSGGVFQNMILLKKAVKLLKNNDFNVFVNKNVPTNDGGIALGQAWIAHRLLTRSLHSKVGLTNREKFNKIKR